MKMNLIFLETVFNLEMKSLSEKQKLKLYGKLSFGGVHSIAYNGSQVYLVADLEAQNLNLIQNENRNTKLG